MFNSIGGSTYFWLELLFLLLLGLLLAGSVWSWIITIKKQDSKYYLSIFSTVCFFFVLVVYLFSWGNPRGSVTLPPARSGMIDMVEKGEPGISTPSKQYHEDRLLKELDKPQLNSDDYIEGALERVKQREEGTK